MRAGSQRCTICQRVVAAAAGGRGPRPRSSVLRRRGHAPGAARPGPWGRAVPRKATARFCRGGAAPARRCALAPACSARATPHPHPPLAGLRGCPPLRRRLRRVAARRFAGRASARRVVLCATFRPLFPSNEKGNGLEKGRFLRGSTFGPLAPCGLTKFQAARHQLPGRKPSKYDEFA